MSVSMKLLSIPLSLSVVVFSGCNSGEVSQKTEEAAKQVEQKAEEATGQVKEQSKEITETVKKETPGIVQNMRDTYKEAEQKVKDNTLQKGDKAKIKKDAYLALTPETYDELYQLVEVNDLKGVERIEKDKKVISIKKGSEVEVVERDLRRTKIKVKETGKEGYLPTSALEPGK